MALRTLEDPEGRRWEIWDVHPSGIERGRRHEGEPQASDLAVATARPKTFTLPTAMRDGWLAFRCDCDARRLAPIPPDWETMPDDALVLLLSTAMPARRRQG